jgi:hypothetical protein
MLGLSPIYGQHTRASQQKEIREMKQKGMQGEMKKGMQGEMRNIPNTPHAHMMSMLPSPSIMKAMGTLLPRAFALTQNKGLDESLIPKDSSIRHLFETEENTNKSSNTKTTVSHHNINTSMGRVQISSIVKEY